MTVNGAPYVPRRGSRWQAPELGGLTYTVEGYIAPAALTAPDPHPAEFAYAVEIGKVVCRTTAPTRPLALLPLADFPQPHDPGRLLPADAGELAA